MEFPASQKIYAVMLRVYPRRHREEYGTAMRQLFRDQCRDAWDEDRNWGMTKLWLRLVPDLINSSIWERITALKERKTMNDNLAGLATNRNSSAGIFISVFVTVFLITSIIATAITFVLPESYASTCRLKVENDQPGTNNYSYDPYFIQTTFEIINSQLVLSNVIAKLNLNVEWGKKFFNGDVTLKTTECVQILTSRMALAPVKNTKLIAITVYSEDKNEAATIANAVAEAYKNYRFKTRDDLAVKGLEVLEKEYLSESNQIAGMREDGTKKEKLDDMLRAHELLFAKIESEKLDAKIPKAQMVQVTDPAEPGHFPVRPNKLSWARCWESFWEPLLADWQRGFPRRARVALKSRQWFEPMWVAVFALRKPRP